MTKPCTPECDAKIFALETENHLLRERNAELEAALATAGKAVKEIKVIIDGLLK